MQLVAEDLAQSAARLCREAEYRDTVPLRVTTPEIELGVRQPDESRLSLARELVRGIQNPDKLTRPQVYAEEAIALAAGPERVSVPLQAICIGDLGIAAAPCEVFAEIGLEIKARSQLKHTLLIELANGFKGYLPPPEQHTWGGYKTKDLRRSA